MARAFDSNCDRLTFQEDVNLDGLLTVSDYIESGKSLFMVPSKAALAVLDGTKGGAFFEIDCASGKGGGAIFFSLVAWLIVFGIAYSVVDGLKRRADAKLKRKVRSGWTRPH